MPNLQDRERREQELTERIAALLLLLRRDVEHGTADYAAIEFQLRQELAAGLGGTFSASGMSLAALHGDGVTFDTSGDAMLYGDAMASVVAAGIIANTQAAVAQAAAQGMNIDAIFSRARASSISVTEITRAISAGERRAASTILALGGPRIVSRWRTERDGEVCPICEPLDDKGESIYQRYFPAGPPAHPNCRCDLVYSLSPGPLVGA